MRDSPSDPPECPDRALEAFKKNMGFVPVVPSKQRDGMISNWFLFVLWLVRDLKFGSNTRSGA
jgi:hypothetical protein